MIRVLFVNSANEFCGVHQYGENLFGILKTSRRIKFDLFRPVNLDELRSAWLYEHYDALIWNWAPGIGGWMKDYPFGISLRNIAIYHDGHLDPSRFEAVLFSDPTMPSKGKWHSIGRPLPEWEWEPEHETAPTHPMPWIGVNGFLGAWAPIAVRKILSDFKQAHIRLHLPSATYGDPTGAAAQVSAQQCRELCQGHPGITMEVCHDFLSTYNLLRWLRLNDLNVYMRDLPPTWRGVSSVLDPALAARRPIAVNLCTAFRHVHNLNPSICAEHNSLPTILENGIRPLEPLYQEYAPHRVRVQVEDVVWGLF